MKAEQEPASNRVPGDSTDPSMLIEAAGCIASLWHRLRSTPVVPELWQQLSFHYAAAGLEAQQAYAVGQWRRLHMGTTLPQVSTLPEPDLSVAPGIAWAELLQTPGSEPAQLWCRKLRDWLLICPGDWLSWLYVARLQDGVILAAAQTEGGVPKEEALAQACQGEPISGESLHWLGVWRLEGGDHLGAIEALAGLVDQRPMRHGSMLFLGEALLRAGNRAAAEAAFTRASASRNPAFLRFLAQRVYQHNYWREAIAVLEQALALAPADGPTLTALARLHWEVYQLSQAESLCQRILALDPGHGDVRYLLNALPGRRGDAAAHLAAVEAHYSELEELDSRLASSIAMASLYVDHLTPAQVAERHRQLCRPIEAELRPNLVVEENRDPLRPLRIGLVSGDFHRQHPVNLFMLPLLERLDQQQFPTTVFHTGSMQDEYTIRARGAVSGWLEVANMDDNGISRRIREQHIDLLIDLAGHTSNHRLGVFAMRSAPVQVTFLGYPHSTGLSRIDWLIGDAVVTPAEHAQLFSEGIAQLAGSVFCWRPVDDYPLPAARPADAPLVFGSFNNVMKLSPRTMSLWASLLHDLPDAELLLKAPSLADASVIARFRNLFAAEGIAAERLRFEGPEGLEQMMQRYGAIDIGLDPTPYNGGTTTLQALWMGVPVITLLGGNFVSRMGASFLTALGRPEWIATNEEHYRAIARELAATLPALRQQRAALRQAMLGSRLSDLDSYTTSLQQLLRRMWQAHCDGASTRLLASTA